MIRPQPMLVLAAAFSLGGCLAPDEPGDSPEEQLEPSARVERAGIVLAEHTDGSPTSVHAQFVHARGLTTERAFEALELWTPDEELDLDACSLRGNPEPLDESFTLELLDVGPITIEVADEAAELQARRLPDLLAGVSGVVYGSEEGFVHRGVHIPFVPGEIYRVAAPGTERLGGFDVEVEAPEPLQILELGGYPHQPQDDLTLRWVPGQTNAEGDLYLDIGPAGRSGRLRCHLDDDGHFMVPRAVLESLAPAADGLELTLRRVALVDTPIDGLDSSAFVFSTTRRFLLSPP